MKKIYKRKSLRRLAAAVCAALVAGTFTLLPNAEALRGGVAMPILDAKDAAVSIATNGNVMDITSTAQDNLIKWVDFSISSGKTVDFHDKNYLNYVTGSAVSDIQGILKGTGNIYLVNPNGILIGDGATINVGNLYLSTKNLTDAQLADYSAATGALFKSDNAALGDVINMGKLNANSVTVEGNNITFKNVADVKNGGAINTNVKLTANSGGEIHLGFANETEAANVNNSEYTAVNEPTLTGWTTSGTTHKYMLVRNKYELQNMQNNLAGNYMLAKSIDMNGFENFKPIGNLDSSFVGKFDGLNYAVENLNINTSANDVGLFGFNDGKIENVGMVGGSRIGKDRVGGVAGGNTGTVKHVYSTGTVNGADWVGGVVGQNVNGMVENAYNTGTVKGERWVGGVVGQNDNGTVKNAYNTGEVTGENWVGGVVGQNIGTVTNAYNAGDVTATGTFKGPIVGLQAGTLTKAYSSSDGNLKQAATFTDFRFVNGVSSDGVWRLYEGKTMPLLTAFMTRKDNITNTTVEYNGTATGDVGARYAATAYNDVQAQNGYNYISDVSFVTPKDLTVSFGSITKVYDGTTNATANGNLTGVIAGDTLTVTATGNYDDKNVGTGKTVNYTGFALSGSEAGNYNLTTTAATGTGTITRKALSLVATPQTITEGAATPTEWSGSVTGFVADERLGANDTLSFALDNPEAAAVGSYKVTGTLNGEASGNYGDNYTFANAAANATAFTIAAKYVPPAPTPTPSAPSGGNGGNTGSTTPTNPTTPTEPTPTTPSGGDSGNTGGNTGSTTPTPSTTPITPTPTTPNSGGNTSGTGANTPAPLAAAEPVIVAAVTETETIAAAATAGATAEMTHIADNVRPTSLTEQPTNGGENAAAAPLAAAGETAANAQDFTLTAGGLLAVSNETNSAPKDAMSVESIGHALSTLQHGSGEKSAATAPNTETKSAADSIGDLDEAVEATDLAIGTEIAETDRESGAGQENLASDTGTAGGADESAEESKEKKKQQ